MKIFSSSLETFDYLQNLKYQKKTIGFVPTMGYLHIGHLSLVDIAAQHADIVVMSIYVNPTQFGPSEDFEKYPRDLNRDIRLIEKKVDVLFTPETNDIYGLKDIPTWKDQNNLESQLCGKSRPGHFKGVAEIVLRLFKVVDPQVAVFGEKDYQQLTLIRRMVEDLGLKIKILGGPTLRDSDGLALSSRNVYLNPESRKEALTLYEAIQSAQNLVKKGELSVANIKAPLMRLFNSHPSLEIDYVEIVNAHTLAPLEKINQPARLMLAVRIQGVRLIDNASL